MASGPNLTDGTVTIDGPRFDLPRVLDAAERVVDLLASRIGRDATYVTTDRPGFGAHIPWPDPGKEIVRTRWRAMAERYEVVDEAMVHVMGDVTLKAFLLGKTWCVRHKDGRLTLPDLETPAEQLMPTPTICLYGERRQDELGAYGVLPTARMRDVRIVLQQLLEPPAVMEIYGLASPEGGGPTHQIGFLRFPYDFYGDGRGAIRVRCVEAPDLDSE